MTMVTMIMKTMTTWFSGSRLQIPQHLVGALELGCRQGQERMPRMRNGLFVIMKTMMIWLTFSAACCCASSLLEPFPVSFTWKSLFFWLQFNQFLRVWISISYSVSVQ